MGKLILITGGARSGKSRYAIELVEGIGKKVTFIATCIPEDNEMRERIEKHKNERPTNWQTIEGKLNLRDILMEETPNTDIFIIDCLTLFISKMMVNGFQDNEITSEIRNICSCTKEINKVVIFITNEVGSGIVPESELGRRFRDLAGRVNQCVANFADEVYFMVSGIPVKIKGGN